MLPEKQLTIPKVPVLDKSENYEVLYQEGLKWIEKLSGKVWTDYNTHDPGITTLELLCYAITDLGYRTSFDMADLLTPAPTSNEDPMHDFYTAAEILPVNPTTMNDLRKLIIDVKGVKNAWITKANTTEIPIYTEPRKHRFTTDISKGYRILPLNGLFNVLLEFELPPDGKEDDELSDEEKQMRSNQRELVRSEVRRKVMAHRNLCEDLLGIQEVNYDDIAICADIEVQSNADINKVNAAIYQIAYEYFSPQLNFYALEEMIEKGKTIDQIFDGPRLVHGFIDSEELEASTLRTELHVSDLYNSIMDLPEVVAIKSFKLLRYISGKKPEEAAWTMPIRSLRAPRLSRGKSKMIFYKGFLPFMGKEDDVRKEFVKRIQNSRRFRKVGHKDDIDLPTGRYRELEDYFPVQNDFPVTYGIGNLGLPDSVSDARKAQAKQMKAYLLIFEQILANYLAQLAGVGKLFSSNQTIDRRTLTINGKSYFSQALKDIDGLEDLLRFANYHDDLQLLVEDEKLFSERRNKILDHLIARFCEEMTDYSLLVRHHLGESEGSRRLISDKEALLFDYAALSRDRGKAFDYRFRLPTDDDNKESVWNTTNISGLKLRIARLIGLVGTPVEDENDSFLRVLREGDGHYVELVDENGELLLSSGVFEKLQDAVSFKHYLRECINRPENFKKFASEGHEFLYIEAPALQGDGQYEIFSAITIKEDGGNYFVVLKYDGIDYLKSKALTSQAKGVKLINAMRVSASVENTLQKVDDTTYALVGIPEDLNVSVAQDGLKGWVVLVRDDADNVIMRSKYFQTKTSTEDYIWKIVRAAYHDAAWTTEIVSGEFYFYLSDIFGELSINGQFPELLHSIAYAVEATRDSVLADARKTLAASVLAQLPVGTTYHEEDIAQVRRILLEQIPSAVSNPLSPDLVPGETKTPFEKLDEQVKAELTEVAEKDTILRRTIAPNFFEIVETTVGDGLETSKVWYVSMKVKPADSSSAVEVLRTYNEDSIVCAQNQKMFILQSGDDEERYDFDVDGGKHYYKLYSDCEEDGPIARGPNFDTKEDCRKALTKLIQTFRAYCDVEDFHLVEHILLRPHVLENKLLPACVEYNKSVTSYKETPAYTIEIQKEPNGYSYTIRSASGIVMSSNGSVKTYQECLDSINLLRTRAMSESNYLIQKSTKKFSITIPQLTSGDENDEPLEDLATSMAYPTLEAMNAEIAELVMWFAFQEDLTANTPPAADCTIQDDPYSFRVSFVLPSWPTRFRSAYFRQYVERIIRQETPAHIYAKICWVGLDQMSQFENDYQAWLKTLNERNRMLSKDVANFFDVPAVPTPEIADQFVETLFSLTNVYPTAILHSCEDIESDEPEVILGYTSLGSF
jgi:hypothetical protein